MGKNTREAWAFLRDCFSSKRQVPPRRPQPDNPSKGLFKPEHLVEHLERSKARRHADLIDFVDDRMVRGIKRRPNKAGPVHRQEPVEHYQITVGKGLKAVTMIYEFAPIPKVTFGRDGRGRYMPTGKPPKKPKPEEIIQDVTGGQIVLKGINF